MKHLGWIFLFTAWGITARVEAQMPIGFAGTVTFTYSGALNGTFSAATELPGDTLALPDDGALALAVPDSGARRVFMTAFQKTGDQVYQLMLAYLKDETDSLNAQTWTFPTDITDPAAVFLFLPEVDTSLVNDLVGLIDTAGVDSSNADSLFLDVIASLLQSAYLATGGNLTLETSGEDSLGGSFALTCLQAPFSILNITNGTFAFAPVTVPALATETDPPLPADFALMPPTPNPFNPVTTIRYRLREEGRIQIGIYDVRGRQVEQLYQGWSPAGEQRLFWDASRRSSGIYFVRLTHRNHVQTRKVLLLK